MRDRNYNFRETIKNNVLEVVKELGLDYDLSRRGVRVLLPKFSTVRSKLRQKVVEKLSAEFEYDEKSLNCEYSSLFNIEIKDGDKNGEWGTVRGITNWNGTFVKIWINV